MKNFVSDKDRLELRVQHRLERDRRIADRIKPYCYQIR